MKRILLFAVLTLLFSYCEEDKSPCNGSCGLVIADVTPSGCYFGANQNCIHLRIENDCSGEIATFTYTYSEMGSKQVGDYVCNYQ